MDNIIKRLMNNGRLVIDYFVLKKYTIRTNIYYIPSLEIGNTKYILILYFK